MALPHFDYVAPRSVEELLESLSSYGARARILAGGTDLLILLRERLVKAECLIDIGRLPQLKAIVATDEGLSIGAAARIRDLQRSSLVRERYFALYQAACDLGSNQVRDMATVGGNACNGSPAADTPPALIALGAQACLRSARGRRQMPLEAFILGPRRTALAADEILESLHLPQPWPRSASRYACAGLRDAMEIDIANIAVNLALDPSLNVVTEVRIAMGAVAPTQIRALRAEAVLKGHAPDAARIEMAALACSAESAPIDDMRASAAYRRQVLKPLARRALAQALAAIRKGDPLEAAR
ncbi:MAG: xanthine dehydrogenase family protein subunit M [Burkholderiales bacterium]|nr:xanthine dehydrogenase family protein subunit M [Burkholderiales bacterium]